MANQTKYCRECGQQLRASAQYCDACGAEQQLQQPQQPQQQPQPSQVASPGQPTVAQEQHQPPPGAPQPRQQSSPQQQSPPQQQPQVQAQSAGQAAQPRLAESPAWPLGVLAGCWVLWFAGAVVYGSQAATGGLIMLVAVVGSLPVMYVDAKNGKRAGELEVEYPAAVPLATLLLWVLALPAYLIYRWTNR